MITRALVFKKEPDGRWFVDLPEWEGDRADLQMVAGADQMLEYMAEGGNVVNMNVSETEFEGSDRLLFMGEAGAIGSGAFYLLYTYRGIELNHEMWLCDVTKFIFGKFPVNIYVSTYV